MIRALLLKLPIRAATFDLSYSFGVLHHTTDPLQGLQEIVRTLNYGDCASLYLYEDHADNFWKALPLKMITLIRVVTTKLNTRVLSWLCYLLSPFIVGVFSITAQCLRLFASTRSLADQVPFNFGTSLFSVHGDLVDRFGVPIEIRYSREEVTALLQSCCLKDFHITKQKTSAGWVAKGIK